MWACVRVWVAVLLLATGFEVSGSLRALVCLIAFLSHWSAVAAILLQCLHGCNETVNGRGSNLLRRDCPSKSCSQATLSPGNPHGSQTERERERASLTLLSIDLRGFHISYQGQFGPSGFHCFQWLWMVFFSKTCSGFKSYNRFIHKQF